MELRPYQVEVVQSIRAALNRGVMSPCAAVPTGGGKGAILSYLAKAFVAKGHRTLALTTSKELIAQLSKHADIFGIDHGIYAVSHKRRDKNQALIIAQIQSVWRKIADLGAFTCCIIDESHQVSKSEDSMYAQAISTLRIMNPKLRLIGLSATPWRMGEGYIHGPGKMFDECVTHITMKRLIDEGWLTPLVGKSADCHFDESKVKIRAGDYAANDLEREMTCDDRVKLAVAEILAQTTDRNKVLIFSSGLKHNAMIVEEFASHGHTCLMVDGTMPDEDRDRVLAEFNDGPTRFLVNANILTTGYDNRQIDCIALLRPTRSTVLLLQMVGRGLRLYPGKANCKVLDFGRVIETLGALDQIETNIREVNGKAKSGECPMKSCPTCKSIIHSALTLCPDCGHEFPRTLKHEEKASSAAVFTTAQHMKVKKLLLSATWKNVNGHCSVRVQYVGDDYTVTEFLCWEHSEWMRRKALDILRNWPMREAQGRRLEIREGVLYGTVRGLSTPLRTAAQVSHFGACLVTPTAVDWTPEGKFQRIDKRYF